ncbi:unnamed protein product [Ostreobium quekettii]|uniref:alpha-1,2-Mannosidase n=1 Tax=Ostreobium quekettii TaxID=121088 RepID=A0A8S1J5M8_9CHLO|nr:unnamed protein product [Ostreobium quekettii]|eukprot:evm.model.scf_1281EXC.7 EVM.evm.TU.scf_1281EXC.7   scf_1281EXC:23532-25430(+)
MGRRGLLQAPATARISCPRGWTLLAICLTCLAIASLYATGPRAYHRAAESVDARADGSRKVRPLGAANADLAASPGEEQRAVLAPARIGFLPTTPPATAANAAPNNVNASQTGTVGKTAAAKNRTKVVPQPAWPGPSKAAWLESLPAWGIRRELDWTPEAVRGRVRGAFLHAWGAYKRFAWGHDELKPISQTYKTFSHIDMGLTIVDAADTMVVMGLEGEYAQAREWIATHLDFGAVNASVSFFETTIRFLGGLLSTHYLTGDAVYLDKAVDLGARLARAFNTSSGLPEPDVHLMTGALSNSRKTHELFLAEIGSCQLEMAALSRLSGNETFTRLAEAAEGVVLESPSWDGLRTTSMSSFSRRWWGLYSMGNSADSYYEYLLKRHIQARALGEPPETSQKYGAEFAKAMAGMARRLVRKTAHGLSMLADVGVARDNEARRMHHLACFVPGTLALGAATTTLFGDRADEMMALARELALTCYSFYKTTRTGLGPDIVSFPMDADYDMAPTGVNGNHLRPETVESLFVLYRLTGDRKYRQWGMDIFVAWETYARLPAGGYSTLLSVADPGSHGDSQESFFLAESLKYLYLLFEDPAVLPLDEWVFNTEAHPFSLDRRWSPEAGRRTFEWLMSRE